VTVEESLSKHNVSTLLFLLGVTEDDESTITRNTKKFSVNILEQFAGDFFITREVSGSTSISSTSKIEREKPP
jgi:hypothetical protein